MKEKFCEFICYTAMSIIALIFVAFVVILLILGLLGPVILAEYFDCKWLGLLYFIYLPFMAMSNPQYFTRNDNQEMP